MSIMKLTVKSKPALNFVIVVLVILIGMTGSIKSVSASDSTKAKKEVSLATNQSSHKETSAKAATSDSKPMPVYGHWKN